MSYTSCIHMWVDSLLVVSSTAVVDWHRRERQSSSGLSWLQLPTHSGSRCMRQCMHAHYREHRCESLMRHRPHSWPWWLGPWVHLPNWGKSGRLNRSDWLVRRGWAWRTANREGQCSSHSVWCSAGAPCLSVTQVRSPLGREAINFEHMCSLKAQVFG